MKANITRGNSVTENYNPYSNLEDLIIHAMAIRMGFVQELLQRARPIPKFKSGSIISESGRELIKTKDCKYHISPNTIINKSTNAPIGLKAWAEIFKIEAKEEQSNG